MTWKRVENSQVGYSPAERAICRLVGTPIGNLGDITPRAVQALAEADIIFAEDTRTAKALLHHLNISKPVRSYHKDNEQEAMGAVLKEIAAGHRTAVISEAGMPAISDPGFLLINELFKKHIPFEIVPGVSAATHAAVASGLCKNGQYLFYGFLPHKGPEKEVDRLIKLPFSIVFYESPHRAKETIKLLLAKFPPPVAVCRELTKLHEEIIHINDTGDLETLTVKGEFCLVVDNSAAKAEVEQTFPLERLAELLVSEEVSTKSAVNILKALGMKRNEAYERVQKKELL